MLKLMVKIFLQFYTQKLCLSKLVLSFNFMQAGMMVQLVLDDFYCSMGPDGHSYIVLN